MWWLSLAYCLIYLIILGIDFLPQNETSVPVSIKHGDIELHHIDQEKVLWHSA